MKEQAALRRLVNGIYSILRAIGAIFMTLGMVFLMVVAIYLSRDLFVIIAMFFEDSQ